MFKNILILCTGNICRSPMAEAVLRERLAHRGAGAAFHDDIGDAAGDAKAPAGPPTVSSAGTSALIGHPADPLAIEVAGQHGFDLASHRARQASPPLFAAADLVLVMTRAHADWVHERVPLLRGRVQLLGRWRELEIPDPYGQPRKAFASVFEQIDDCVADWLPRL